MRERPARPGPAPLWGGERLAQRCPGCGTMKNGHDCPRCDGAGTAREDAPLMAKASASRPGEVHEREADLVADAIVGGDREVPREITPAAGRRAQRATDGQPTSAPTAELEDDEGLELEEALEEMDEEESPDLLALPEGPVQRKAQGPAGAGPAVARGEGAAMDGQAGAFMERRFGHSFADVRVHADDAAAASAERIGARAYTRGSHIYFAQGQYRPSTTEGRRLLAHELTHVLQQRAGAQGVFMKKGDKAATPAAKKAGGPKRIKVFLDTQRAVAMEGTRVVRTMGISSGKPGHPTDPGTFKVTEKDADHHSSKYGKCGTREVSAGASSCKAGETYAGAPMKHFLRFNGAEGFHQGVLPGHAASHGCVRLGAGDAQWLFKWAAVGTPVEVLKTTPGTKKKKPTTSRRKPRRKGR